MPRLWQKAKVVFIPKAGKKDYTSVKSFRPICLTSFFLKALERLILWRLQSVEFTLKPLSQFQHAFSPGKSTESALHHVVEKLEKALLGDQFALGVFIDIEGAFDNIGFGAIKNVLEARNMNCFLIRFILFMIKYG
jgi:hypothetical protein